MNRTTHHKQGPAWAALVTAAAICLALATAATAADIAQVRAGSSGLDFQPRVEYGALVLTVSGPDGFHHRAEFGAGESPAFSIFDQAGGVLPDGSYTWELSVVPSDSQRRDAFEANRMEVKRGGVERQVQTGGFAVVAGSVVAGGETEPGDGTTRPGGNVLAPKDQVIPDDLIVQMSLCVGFDCVNNESFGFDTIRLKENNLRIHFDDTSSTGSFPNNDWRLVANDSANGGRNVFYLEDSTSGREVFSVEAGAPSNALWVDATGNVGFGTSTPVLQLHVKDGNTPGLRLEQDGSSGFTAQTWDVAGNEANFFVRSVTTGSQLSFRIRPGAPTSSIDIAADGDVGIGTSSPSSKLHVVGPALITDNDGTTALVVEETSATAAARTMVTAKNNGQTRFLIHNTNATLPANGGYFFAHFDNGTFVIRPNGGGQGFFMDSTGNVTTEADLTVNGTFSNPSSRTLKENFQPVDQQAVLAKLVALPVAEWTYKRDAERRRHVGPTAEDFLDAFGLGSDGKYIFPLDVQGVTVAAVQGLHEKVIELETERDLLKGRSEELETLGEELRSENADLRERIEKLEELMVDPRR